MSQEQLAQFRAKVSQNPALQEQIKGAADQQHVVQQFVKLGSENGHHFSSSDIEEFIAKNQLDDVQLEEVAGGLPNASSLIRKPLEPNGIIAILIGL